MKLKVKTLLIVVFILFYSMQGLAQREFTHTSGDSTYTMKRYVFMLLKSGETRSQDSTEAIKIQELHLAHIDSLAAIGKLIVAGPFQDGGDHRGLLIFDVETVEEALELESKDPAVSSGRLKMDAFYWWGAKGTVIN